MNLCVGGNNSTIVITDLEDDRVPKKIDDIPVHVKAANLQCFLLVVHKAAYWTDGTGVVDTGREDVVAVLRLVVNFGLAIRASLPHDRTRFEHEFGLRLELR
jgi:hypothetical protein